MRINHLSCRLLPKNHSTTLLEITDTEAQESYYLDLEQGQSLHDAMKTPKGDSYITTIWNNLSQQEKDQLRQFSSPNKQNPGEPQPSDPNNLNNPHKAAYL